MLHYLRIHSPGLQSTTLVTSTATWRKRCGKMKQLSQLEVYELQLEDHMQRVEAHIQRVEDHMQGVEDHFKVGVQMEEGIWHQCKIFRTMQLLRTTLDNCVPDWINIFVKTIPQLLKTIALAKHGSYTSITEHVFLEQEPTRVGITPIQVLVGLGPF